MAEKVFKSTWTWRTLAHQEKIVAQFMGDELYQDAPYFTDGERDSMFRPTTRHGSDDLYVSSISVLAQDENDLAKVVANLNKCQMFLHCAEEAKVFQPKISLAEAAKLWKQARVNGAAMIGGRISAERRQSKVKEAAEKIKDRWKLPSGEWPTHILLEEAAVSLNSIKSVLGNRPIAQRNYRAAQKRKEIRDAGIRNHAG
jgi:hypothetical protein